MYVQMCTQMTCPRRGVSTLVAFSQVPQPTCESASSKWVGEPDKSSLGPGGPGDSDGPGGPGCLGGPDSPGHPGNF